MKTLLIALMMIGTVQAGEVGVRLTDWSRLADDNVYQVGNWQGIQLDYTFDNDLYIFGSHETAQVIPLWPIGDLSMTGIGFGVKHDITPRFRFYGQVGYYFVSHENEGRHPIDMGSGDASEGMWMYMNHQYSYLPGFIWDFDTYEIQYENTFSGIIGIDYTHPVGKSSEVTFGISYRALRMDETFIVERDEWNYPVTLNRWEQMVSRNYGALGLSLGYNYTF